MTSWVISCKETGNAILATFNKKKADSVNSKLYVVEWALGYLGRFNKEAKEGEHYV